MTVQIRFENGDKLGRKLQASAKLFDERRIKGIQAVARRAAEEIETEGRADMRAGGNFGSARWQEGFRAKVSYLSRSDIRIRITHAVSYWRVFEFGAFIKGNPLLWIPLSFSEAGKLKVRARDFPGKLFRVNREGKNPLLMNEDGAQYVGVPSVRIPKKWHLRQIARNVSHKLHDYYREAMRNGRRS